MNIDLQEIRQYIAALFGKEDDALIRAREYSKVQKLPEIHISAEIGKLLSLLVLISKPRRILEIGTLDGYSTLWLAKYLPEDGRIISIELNPAHIAIAKENTSAKQNYLTFIQGDAANCLLEMANAGEKPFDLIFIDGNKQEYPDYLKAALLLSKKGTIIISDNLIPKRGKIGTAEPHDLNAQSIYHFNEIIAAHPRFESILLPKIPRKDRRLDGIGITYVL